MPLIIPGNSQASTGYTIDQSIRFNDDDSPSLDKTYSGAGSRTTFTFSCWFKIGNTSTSFPFFNGGTGTSDTGWTGVALSSSSIYVQGYNTNWKITTRKLRDHSAWYHLVFVWDTTNTIASERIRIYINGQRETDFSTDNNPSASAQAGIGQAQKHSIGYQSRSVGYGYADAYFAEIHFLDGYAYDPSFFGEFNDSGIWIPKEYTGSYGSNGFKIDGRDASDLGDDESGNGNDFTSNNLTASDQVLDSPTNNFAVANPLDSSYYMGSETFSEGNLQMTLGSSVGGLATMGITSGKWYAEFEVHSGSATYFILGIYGDQPTSTQHFVGYTSNSYGYYALNGNSYTNFTSSSYGNSYTVGDVVGVAVDLDNNKLYFSKNGTFQNSGDPTSGASGTGALSINPVSSTGLGAYFIASSSANSTPSSHTINYNFGQDGTFAGNVTAGGNSDGNGVGNFKYSVPSGYLALCTKNLGS